jgi:hypothetical protein
MADTSNAPYAGFLQDLVERFDERLKRIKVEHNFEYGDEFEIAICEVLRQILPSRVGICRGYVVDRGGTTAGDDIILFDVARFPTLRLLQGDLSLKERVPVDAVLAYIEAKHTLYVEGEEGQSMIKAIRQVRAVKRLTRPPVDLLEAGGIVFRGGFQVEHPVGYPARRNPIYAAIWAPHLNVGKSKQPQHLTVLERADDIRGDVKLSAGPDVIAAGQVLVSPVLPLQDGTRGARPFITDECELNGSTHEFRALGLAVFHLLWAIEWVQLGAMPWELMVGLELKKTGFTVLQHTVPGTQDG